MDGKNYFQCPRRFIRRTDELENNPDPKGGPKAQWDIADTTEVPPDGVFVATHLDTGRCYQDTPTHAIGDKIAENYYGYVPDDMRPFLNYQGGAMYPVGEPHHWILKNDGSRYTIMKKLNNVNPNQAGLEWNEGLVNDARRAKPTFTHHPPYYARDPEYFQYVIDREQIELSTDEGFSSASNIAHQPGRLSLSSSKLVESPVGLKFVWEPTKSALYSSKVATSFWKLSKALRTVSQFASKVA